MHKIATISYLVRATSGPVKLGNLLVVEHLKSTEINLEWIYYSQYLLVARSEWICFENIMANFISNLEKSPRFEKCRKGCSELDSNGVAMLGQRRRARAQLAGKYKFDIPASFNINIINLDGRKYMIFSYNPAAGYDESVLGSSLTRLRLVDALVWGKTVLHKKCMKNYRSFFYHFCTPNWNEREIWRLTFPADSSALLINRIEEVFQIL